MDHDFFMHGTLDYPTITQHFTQVQHTFSATNAYMSFHMYSTFNEVYAPNPM
jgi:hypothetical protein